MKQSARHSISRYLNQLSFYMRRCTPAIVVLLLGCSMSTAQVAIPITNNSDPAGANATQQQQSAVFIENKGQWDRRARYLLRTGGLDVWVTDRGVIYDLYQMNTVSGSKSPTPVLMSPGSSLDGPHGRNVEPQQRVGHAVEMQFVGTSTASEAHGTEQQSGYHNYFIGNDRSKWASNVGLYAGARIERLYDGVDAVFYLDGGKPRYDLVVSPGANPAAVRMKFTGSNGIRVASDGSLLIATSVGELKQQGLFAYQMVGSETRQVRCGFVRGAGNVVRFDVGSYDRSRPLVIDPLVYSTYLGGSGGDVGYGVAVDGIGNAYVTGSTSSTNFPVLGAYQSSKSVGLDAFITKLTASGNDLVFSTFLGGNGTDIAYGIAVDGNNNAYVVGHTRSTTFPTVLAVQPSTGGETDAFVTKLSSNGDDISYSTYLGGNDIDGGYGIVVDGDYSAYITGLTGSINFPTSNAFQSSYGGGTRDGFVTKFTSDGSSLVYSTYLGGSSEDAGYGIAVDAGENAHITGYTYSGNFPTASAIQPNSGGGTDGFVTKLDNLGSSLVYSTYLGGSNTDIGVGMAVDGSNSAYVLGYTLSSNFPTSGAIQPVFGGGADAFVVKLTNSGDARIYSTYLGGSSDDVGHRIMADASGSAYVTGYTFSGNFPTFSAVQALPAGGRDAFVSKLNSSGSILLYSTYLGGHSADDALGISIDASGNAYIVGSTSSANFPTVNAYRSSRTGSSNVFVSKLSAAASITLTSPNGGENWYAGSTHAITWTSTGINNIKLELSSDGGSTWATTIVASTLASGTFYPWTIPLNQTPGVNYRVRATDVGNSAIYDISNANFTVSAPGDLYLVQSAVSVFDHSTDNTADIGLDYSGTDDLRGVQVTIDIPTPNIQPTSVTLGTAITDPENWILDYDVNIGSTGSGIVLILFGKTDADIIPAGTYNQLFVLHYDVPDLKLCNAAPGGDMTTGTIVLADASSTLNDGLGTSAAVVIDASRSVETVTIMNSSSRGDVDCNDHVDVLDLNKTIKVAINMSTFALWQRNRADLAPWSPYWATPGAVFSDANNYGNSKVNVQDVVLMADAILNTQWPDGKALSGALRRDGSGGTVTAKSSAFYDVKLTCNVTQQGVDLWMENRAGVSSLQMDLRISGSADSIEAQLNGAYDANFIVRAKRNGEIVRVLLYSLSGDTIATGNGHLLKLVLPIADPTSVEVVDPLVVGDASSNQLLVEYDVVSTPAGVEPGSTDKGLTLQVLPTPMGDRGLLRLELSERGITSLRIVDATGREVLRVLDHVLLQAGPHKLSIDASSLPSGLYICTVQAGSQTTQQTMLVVR